MKNLTFLCLTVLVFSSQACKSKVSKSDTASTETKQNIYRGSVTILNDLIHTKLEVEPDFEKKEMSGTATLTLKPHFYPVDSLVLDARYMRIEAVELLDTRKKESYNLVLAVPLKYSYDSSQLHIALNKRYTSKDTYIIQIRYVAQPQKIKGKASAAITDNKGLYFIGPDNKDPEKPVQLWTQGETQDASCWFPTIDAPNQKTTQELEVSVEARYTTISNGFKAGSVPFEKDGKSYKKDYWKQDKPHAPYLFALVVGDFAEVKDQWNTMPVNYYVEHEYEPYARMVFGNTPKMIDFYSKVLQTPFPWDKYHQVVVRDFVSGAMENTSCVVHYDKLQHNSRQHLDNPTEDIIAHELFHHWFGDLVTCESWSNLPLNESFATYGEYLWDEHQYSRDDADDKLDDFRNSYLNEAGYKQVDLIRYDYEDQEDMFDGHSYQKGGLVLHMLRKYVGDEAFFSSLALYLKRYQYQTAEISQLRTCFEEVTGQDLNWFFNQWFLGAGHAHLDVAIQRNASTVTVTAYQREKTFRLPLVIDLVKADGSSIRHRVTIEKDTQVIVLNNVSADAAVVFDAENQLLSETDILADKSEWLLQFEHAPLAFHTMQAFEKLMSLPTDKVTGVEKTEWCQILLQHPFHKCREMGLSYINKEQFTPDAIFEFSEAVRKLSIDDQKAAVRKACVPIMVLNNDEKGLIILLEDSSYAVLKKAIQALGKLNAPKAYAFASEHRDDKDPLVQEIMYTTIGKYTNKFELDFFLKKIRSASFKEVNGIGNGLANYLVYNQPVQAEEATDSLKRMAQEGNELSRLKAISVLKTLRNFYYYEVFYTKVFIETNKKYKKELKGRLDSALKNYNAINKVVKELEGK